MSASTLHGKGIWAWARAGDELGQAILLARRTGATHILYKVGQAGTYYEDAAPAVRRITEAGLTPFAWTWLTLDDPDREAEVVRRAFADGYRGFVFDMETPCSRKFAAARRLVQALKRSDVNPQDLFLCSFPNISAHTDLPYTEMLEICGGGLMPMAYGSFFAPGDPTPWEVQARRVIDEWTYGHYEEWCLRWGFRPPLYPILAPYHDEYGRVPMKPEEFRLWLDRLSAHGPTFVSFFTARAIADELVPLIGDFAPAEAPAETPVPPPAPEAPPPVTHLRVKSPAGYLNIRQGPGTDTPLTWRVPDGTVLEILEDPQQALAKVGKEGEWIRVRTPSLHEGYAAAWYLAADVPPDNRRPVEDAPLPFGECAWIFGIHGAGAEYTEDFRFLFQDSGKRGWVLFTESIGRNPENLRPNEPLRQKLWDWAHNSGYGVIIRLNHGYEPAGTLPESPYYGAFAATCARWAELYLKHPEVPPSHYTWVIVIGNEPNNVREHPGGQADPREHITPELYARAFNLAYRAIKEVLPNATVVPAAVDPYNTTPWVRLDGKRYCPLTYFKEMLDGIAALDGFALHTYTHGPVVEYITHLRTFTDWPLVPGTPDEHYYDFQAYRPFIEAIPAKWRDKPVYITETNHWTVNPDGTGPAGWINRNIGWVQAAYAEIHRWNSTPHAQQVRALLLYRWQDDEWEIRTKDQIQEDFRQALRNDYRWRK